MRNAFVRTIGAIVDVVAQETHRDAFRRRITQPIIQRAGHLRSLANHTQHFLGIAVVNAPPGKVTFPQRSLVSAAPDFVHNEHRTAVPHHGSVRWVERVRFQLQGTRFITELPAEHIGGFQTEVVVTDVAIGRHWEDSSPNRLLTGGLVVVARGRNTG